MTPASLILIAFSHMLDGFTLGIITRNGYPIQKCDCLTGLGVGHGVRQLSPVTVWRPGSHPSASASVHRTQGSIGAVGIGKESSHSSRT